MCGALSTLWGDAMLLKLFVPESKGPSDDLQAQAQSEALLSKSQLLKLLVITLRSYGAARQRLNERLYMMN